MSNAMTPEADIAQRTATALREWPTLDAAWGCENCRALFRGLDGSGRCVHCGSEAVFDVAELLKRDVVSVERLRPLLDVLDGVLA
jgi:hypothetical protein